MTTENLVRQRTKTMAHLSLKHVTLLGVVRMKLKMKKKTPKKPRLVAPSNNALSFLFNEAVAEEQDDDDEDDGDDDETDEQDFEMYDNLGNFITEPSAHQRGMSESEEEDSDTDEDDDKADVVVADDGDLNEQLVQEGEQAAWDHSYADDVEEPRAAVNDYDHAYAIRPKGVSKSKSKIGKKSRYKYSFLFAVVISGVCKKIKNSIPNAVATLSNSKTIILSHINFMLECLDPGLAELCYIDTDSCIWSFTHPQLEDNLLKTKRDRWKSLDVIADEQGALSCHGKLKLEGTFRVGMFKALKIYRLFSTTDFEQERRNKTCYTRCKGVNRNIAKIIPNKIFEKDSTEKVVVHRSCLRPSRTGEMLIAHECKSLAAPFNLKRHVTDDGIHTFPISYVADGDGGEAFSDQI
jgi:hypothetical protein